MAGDTHSAWKLLYKMIEIENPDIFVHCGDWGCSLRDLEAFEKFVREVKIPVLTIYGNHDDVKTIRELKVENYRWLPNFNMIFCKGFRFMGINGNVAGRPRFAWHVSEAIIREELRLCTLRPKSIDFIVSHECPKGYADILKSREREENGKHKWQKSVGWESLFEVMQKMKPKYWLCGHIHFPQIAQWGKTMIFNAGYGARGDYVLLDTSKEYKPYEWLTSCFRKVKLDD